MTQFDPQAAARNWVAAWNRRDLPELLSHYADGVVFMSPIAELVVGNAIVIGREQLRLYWERALAERQNLRFELEHVLWSPESRLLCILYTSTIDGRRVAVSECQWFDPEGLVCRSTAYYGPDLTEAPREG